MTSFKSLNELEKYISGAMDDTLKNQIAYFVRQEYLDAIDEVVYKSYIPEFYTRRGIHGGLKDPKNIRIEFTKDGTSSGLRLYNITKGATDMEGKLISDFLEAVGNPRGKDTFSTPLPYTDRTINELHTKRGSDAFKGVILEALRRKGIKAKIN